MTGNIIYDALIIVIGIFIIIKVTTTIIKMIFSIIFTIVLGLSYYTDIPKNFFQQNIEQTR